MSSQASVSLQFGVTEPQPQTGDLDASDVAGIDGSALVAIHERAGPNPSATRR